MVPGQVGAAPFAIEPRFMVDKGERVFLVTAVTLGRFVMRNKNKFSLSLVAAGLEDIIRSGLQFCREKLEGFLQGFAVEFELAGYCFKLAFKFLGLGIVLAPVLFVFVRFRVVDPFFLEFCPAGDLVTLHLLLAVPDLLAGNLGGNLAEFSGVSRFFPGFRVFK